MANVGTDILSLPTTVGGLSGEEWMVLVQGGTTKRTQALKLNFLDTIFPAGIDYVISVTDSFVPVGPAGTGLQVPFDCTITGAVLVGDDPNGGAVIDIWKCTQVEYDGGATHPVVGDSITGGNPLTIGSGSQTTSTLIGWTTALTQGDFLWYNVVANVVFTSLTIALKVSRGLP